MTAYSHPLRRVASVLEDVKKPGAFFVSGSVDGAIGPDLKVPGAGAIKLPVIARTAQALISQARMAPYGHGEKTIVDKAVRNTWELNPSQFKITNKQWQLDVVDVIARECARCMGVASPATVQAKLYKMLIYEKGGKFELHRDSEKETGMFGTLVVVLPSSAFRGGELVVYPPDNGPSTQGTPKTWTSGYGSNKAIQYAAFYADCEHAVKPVSNGYRVCLTYNLIGSARSGSQIKKYAERVPELTEALKEFFSTEHVRSTSIYASAEERNKLSKPRMFTYVLDHKYTKDSMKLELLKNKDLAVAQRLNQFCEKSRMEGSTDKYELYLVPVTYCFAYDPEYDYEDEAEKEKSVQLEKGWRGIGKHLLNGSAETEMAVNMESEMAPLGRFDKVKFDSHDTHYTGNEGMRLENWYRTAALVVMPLRLVHRLLIKSGPVEITTQIAFKLAPPDSVCSNEMLEFARLAFDKPLEWVNTNTYFQMCLQAIIKINDVDLFAAVVNSALLYEVDEEPVREEMMIRANLKMAVAHFGWDVCIPKVLAAVTKRLTQLSLRNRVNLICWLAGSVPGGEDAATTSTTVPLSELFEKLLESSPAVNFLEGTYRSDALADKLKISRAVGVPELVRLLQLAYKVDASTPELLTKCIDLKDVPLVEVIVPAFVEFVNGLPSEASATLAFTVIDAATKLFEKVESSLPNVESWAIGPQFEIPRSHCWLGSLCEDCHQIEEFYAAETVPELRLRITGERRTHVTKLITKHLSEFMTWELDRVGRPHALVITKKPVNRERRQRADQALAQVSAIIANRPRR